MNTAALKSVIVRNNENQARLAEILEINLSALNARINGKMDFRRSEINKIREHYHLSPEETIEIFFND